MFNAKPGREGRARPRGPKKEVLILDLDGSGLSLGFWSRRFEGGDEVEEADEESETFPRRSNSTIKILSTYDLDEVWKEILNGEYHAIVVIDLPANETENDIPQPLEGVLRLFVELGGAIAFCGPEGGHNIEHMNRIFKGTEIANWKATSYYRSLWGPCDEDAVTDAFGQAANEMRFSVKATSIQGVRPELRCFGLVPRDSTNEVWQRERIRPDDPEEDFDCCIAVHEMNWTGPGIVGYFGDHNLEDVTVDLIADFVRNADGRKAVKMAIDVDEKFYQAALKLKDGGNKYFLEKKYEKAIEKYDRALHKFARAINQSTEKLGDDLSPLMQRVKEFQADHGYDSEDEEEDYFADYYLMPMEERLVYHSGLSSLGNPIQLCTKANAFVGVHRDEIVKILSNKSECLLRLKMYEEASWSATQALALDPRHEKSLVRNAKACLYMKNRTGLFVSQAYFDLRKAVAINGKGALEARKLLMEVTAIMDKRQAEYGGIELTDHF